MTASTLARRGLSVLLLDRGDPGNAVSGASLACLGTHMMDLEELSLLSWCCEAWRGLAEELGDLEYRACGQLRFLSNPEEFPVAERWIEGERAFGLRPELLDPAAVREVEPALQGPILGATWSPDDAVVNPFLAVRALVVDAQRHGARTRFNCPVRHLLLEDERVIGVATDEGAFHGAAVILTCGPWTAELAATAGVELKIAPRRAQCLATLRLPPTIRRVVGACETAGGVEAGYSQIQQADSGQVLFNTVRALDGPEPSVPEAVPEVGPGFVANSVATLLWLFPALAGASLLRSWVRYEAVTPDDRFLAGRLEPDGLWVAAGDCGTGFVRAPGMARLLADGLTAADPPFPTDCYHAGRFLQ